MRNATVFAGAALWSVLASSVSFAAEDAKTRPSEQMGAATKITLEIKDTDIGKIIDTIAKEMGYPGVVMEKDAGQGVKGTCCVKNKPAWECLVEIFKKHNLTLGNGGIGSDPRKLHIYPAGNTEFTYSPNGPFLVRMWQKPVGTTLNHPGRQPVSVWFVAEPRLQWSCTRIEANEQKNAKGEACDVIGFELVPGGGIQLNKATQPWPGLRSLAIKADMEVVTEMAQASLPSLAGLKRPHVVKDSKGNELFTFEGIKKDGRMMRVAFSFPSTDESSGVAQGGWGNSTEEALERLAGVKVSIVGKNGKYRAPTIAHEGNGKRMSVTFSYSSNGFRQFGGPQNMKLTFAKPVKKATQKLAFQLKTGL